MVVAATIDAADLPDRPRAGNLHQRRFFWILKARALIGVARVAHRAIVDEVGCAVGPEPVGGRTVDAADLQNERLLGLAVAPRHAIACLALLVLPLTVEREAQLRQLGRRVAVEIDELDVA